MAKNENPTQEKPASKEPLDAESQALVAALTNAILSARRDEQLVAPVSPAATAAAAEYALIKAVLRTHLEPPKDEFGLRTRKG